MEAKHGEREREKKDINKITACKMKFMKRTSDHTKWDHKRNENILDKLKIKPMTNYIQNYRRKLYI